VRRIRRLLEVDPAHPDFLLTVRGEGFRLAGQDELARPPGHALRA
jgi:DNA-binding response OmpR family regulator